MMGGERTDSPPATREKGDTDEEKRIVRTRKLSSHRPQLSCPSRCDMVKPSDQACASTKQSPGSGHG